MITGCLEPKPTVKTVKLAGTAISLSKLCAETAISISYLSYIMSGQKIPSIPTAQKIATALGVDTGFLIDALAEQKPKTPRKPFVSQEKVA